MRQPPTASPHTPATAKHRDASGLNRGSLARALLLTLLLVLVLAVSLAPASAAPASPERAVAKVRVPNVVGLRMDRATRLLQSKGLRVNEECTGILGCIIKANWWICSQAPRAGKLVPKYKVVTIFGARQGEC